MNRIFFLFFIILFACRINAQPLSHLYYLTIGNAYYQDASFHSIPDINYSADTVSKLFEKYGTGFSCLSTKDKPFTKRDILSRIDSFISYVVKDTLATAMIYYCGHGESDYQGNLYMIPGKYNVPINTIKQSETADNLIDIDTIQQMIVEKYIENPNDHANFDFHDLMANISMSLQNPHNPNYDYSHSMGKVDSNNHSSYSQMKAYANQMVKHNIDSLRKKQASVHAQFYFFADCCYDKFSTDSSHFDDYSANMRQYLGRNYNAHGEKFISSSQDSMLLDHYADQIAKLSKMTVDMVKNSMRATFNKTGSKVIYATAMGTKAPMVTPLSSDTIEYKYVGPISRRLMLFFTDSRKDFTIYDLLNQITSNRLDDLKYTQPVYLETSTRNGRVSQETKTEDYEKQNFNRRVMRKK